MKDLRARWVFTVGILCLFPEGIRSYWSCKKWVGSDKIWVAICSVLDLYNCSRLVSGVQHVAILQEIVHILFSLSLFFTERFPNQQITPNVITLFANESWNTNKMFLSMCKSFSFLRKYNISWPFVYRFIVLSTHLILSSTFVPRYL